MGTLDKKGISAENNTQGGPRPFFALDETQPTDAIKESNKYRQSGLSTRYDYLKIQRYYAPNKAMRTCSKYSIQSLIRTDEQGRYITVKEEGKTSRRKHYLDDSVEVPDVELKVNEYGATMTGLQTCDNPFCVMCARRRSMQRSEEISKALQVAEKRHWSRFFVTLTIQRQPDPKTAVKEIQRRWRAVQKALEYTYRTKQGVRVEFARAVDVTFKPELLKAGQCYHVHLHCVILIESTFNRNDYQNFRRRILDKWVSSGNSDIVVNRQGQDIQTIRDNEQLAKYVGKMSGLGLELVHSQTKKGKKGGSLSLPQVLEKIIDGDTKLVRLYQDFLEKMKNVRTFSTSEGFESLAKEWDTENPEKSEFQGLSWTIPPHWWAVCLARQCDMVTAAYYWTQRPDRIDPVKAKKQSDILALLLASRPPPSEMDWLLCEWINGSLSLVQIEMVNI